MDAATCPVCGGVNFQPCGKVRSSDAEEVDGKRCLCCCYVFCDFDLALAAKTRARLIAEAVKAALESAAVKCDKQARAWEQYPTVCGVARQCAASIRAMSVKANEETSND